MAGIGQSRPIKLVDETPVLSGGNWVAGNETILRAWANVKRKSGFREASGQAVLGQFFEFTFRYRGDISINANTRLIYDGRKLTVHSLEKKDEQQFFWILTAEAKTFN